MTHELLERVHAVEVQMKALHEELRMRIEQSRRLGTEAYRLEIMPDQWPKRRRPLDPPMPLW